MTTSLLALEDISNKENIITFEKTQLDAKFQSVVFLNLYAASMKSITEADNFQTIFSYENATPIKFIAINPIHICEITPMIPNIKFTNDEFFQKYINNIKNKDFISNV